MKPAAEPSESTGVVEKGRIRILLAHEHSLFREAVRITLEREPDLVVVGMAANATDSLAEARHQQPDVVVLSETLPEGGGVWATALIRQQAPDARVIFLGSDGDRAATGESLLAGASAYLTKNCELPDLIQATRCVASGQMYVAQQMLGPLVEDMARRGRQRYDNLRLLAKLTPRERQVLVLVSAGGDNASIARRLFISPQTARTHIQNVLHKLGLHSRLAAAAFAMQEGVVEILDDLEIAASDSSLASEALGPAEASPSRVHRQAMAYSSVGSGPTVPREAARGR
ncbi:MAG: LuxR C-terminal-related transcriptional regulator [Actinomycetota bacterium]